MNDAWRLDPARTVIASSAFIARDAIVVGDVVIGEDASVWFGAVLRGDTEAIRIGARSNVQDGTVVHADPSFPTLVGDGVTIGHRAIVHGARIGDGAMIGMGAILLNGVEVGPRCLVGAGSLLVPGRTYPAGHLVLGSPARVVRSLRGDELDDLAWSAGHYVDAGRAFAAAGHGRS